ncbi:aminoacyl-tRNA hydrolase [Candidatus Poribacteria bacterium]|nr:aminoacyl-tRNA hydrolase [Candidatus Poribacteria bacterium]MYG06907.1 aminoacyl-tRNA hydrolase [Candidatus Poribacteria bacterium]MYK23208.1 aminoacyl-tRNA hydrolase [Candidatus Poribacteria bacterium]
MDKKVKLIVGLGNPGMRYEHTKHNVGFRVIDALYEVFCQRDAQFPRPTHTSICNSLVIQTTWHDTSIILAKPMTYMNNSGAAVAALVRRFEIPLPELCIVYDDVHLDIGVLRIRQKGSDGGQKGMKSIIHHLGTTAFPRLRIGIGEPIGALIDYVLTEFSADEEIEIAHTLDRAIDALETLVRDDILTAMNKFNSR